MARIIRCSDCEKTFRLPDDKKGEFFKCPKCGQKLRAVAEKTKSKAKSVPKKASRSPRSTDSSDELSSLPPKNRKKQTGGKKSAKAGSLQPFLGRWLKGLGVFMAIATLLSLGGLYSQNVALGVAIMLVVACLIMAVVGRTWMSLDIGKENTLLGVASFFIPLVGVAISARDKGPSLRGAIVYGSLIAPALLGVIVAQTFGPGSGGRRAADAVDRAARAKGFIQQLELGIADDAPVNSSTLKVLMLPRERAGLEAEYEALLTEFPSYVRGSLSLDTQNRTVTLQYRGPERISRAYAGYLGYSTGTMLSPLATAPNG